MIEKTVLNSIPQKPGIYVFKNASKKIIYVGKAKNLKDRLTYYFQTNILTGKTLNLVEEAFDLEYIETLSEADALLLEADFIKKFKPKFNVALKDDKSYLYIRIPKIGRDFIEKFPPVTLEHSKDSDPDEFYGPYPGGSSIKIILKILRKIFLFRDCATSKFKRFRKIGRGCLFCDLNLCAAPCANLINSRNYNLNIKKLKLFLEGKPQRFEAEIKSLMLKKSKNLEFEEANKIKGRIALIEQLRDIKFSPSEYQQNPNLSGEVRKKELESLIHLYNVKTDTGSLILKKGFRIEAYDISNTHGKQATASMVVNVDGESAKKEYRKYKIVNSGKPDDYLMIEEVLGRRFLHKEWNYPQLIVIDGGLGQISSATSALKKLDINIPIMGLAKKFERPVVVGRYLNLNPEDPALNLLKRIRDEAHRFAKTYHKLLRSRKFIGV